MDDKITCLFLPGLPGPQKDYRLLSDIKKFEIAVDWFTYTGTYDLKDQGKFSPQQAIIDIEGELGRLEKQKKPYFIIAYSFSTWVIRQVDISGLKYCQSILLFSPILSLNAVDICTDFTELSQALDRAGDIAIDNTGFEQVRKLGKVDDFSSWLGRTSRQKIPTFVFSSSQDESGLSVEQIDKIKSNLCADESRYIRLFVENSATHKFDSYYDTVARHTLWSVISISEYIKILPKDAKIYLWGSVVGIGSWSSSSDIDVLLINNFRVEDYEHIAEIAKSVELVSGIHVGVSLNRPSDLERRDFVRRNRGAIFLYELAHDAIPFAGEVHIADISRDELKADAILTNKIIRAQISKDLIGYYKDDSVVKKIIKAFVQAVRLTAYSNDCAKIASLDQVLIDDGLQEILNYALDSKLNGYLDVPFDKLYEMSMALNDLVDRQEKMR